MKRINKAFRMSAKDIETMCYLRETDNNGPEYKPTSAQGRMIDDIYRRYITPIDNRDWSADLWKSEQKEPWPSNNRKLTQYQAKRMVIERLHSINERGDLTNHQAADYFHSCLHGIQPGYTSLLYFVYEGR